MEKVKVGYIGGVWDLFHVGHLNYIQKAKEMCDYLVVDVTPDQIVYEQKQKFPIINEGDRMRIVGAIRYVDKVGLSDEGRDYSALNKYGFNVLFLSEDHRGKEYYNNLEAKMREFGVEVVYLPYTQGVSTTAITGTIRGNVQAEAS